MNHFKTSLMLIIAASVTPVQANSLDTARSIESKTNAASAISQKKIDQSVQMTLNLKAEIEQLQEEVDNLEVYRNHLSALVDNQNQEADSLNVQIEEIKHTRQGVVPLMYKMIDGLEQIITNDRPIKPELRIERLTKLKTMMSRANVSDAEKYRRILEAYQIEMDYGTKLGSYQGQIMLASEDEIDADILYLGRVSLVARNLKGDQFWAWDQTEKQWQLLDTSVNSDLDKAYDIASKQAAPSLITLPVSVSNAQQLNLNTSSRSQVNMIKNQANMIKTNVTTSNSEIN